MPWWGYLLIGLLTFGLGALSTWLLFTYKILSRYDAAADALLRSTTEAYAALKASEEAAVERAVRDRTALLEARLAALRVWYSQSQADIAEDARRRYEALAGSPTELDDLLTRLLGPSASAADKPPR